MSAYKHINPDFLQRVREMKLSEVAPAAPCSAWRAEPPDSPGWWARAIGGYQQIYWIKDGETYKWPEKGLWAGPLALDPLLNVRPLAPADTQTLDANGNS